MTDRLTAETFNKALTILAKRDRDLRKVIDGCGNPPMWHRPGGFPTLVLIILEQQVSLASARAAFDRLTVTAGKLTPDRALALSDVEFRAAGVSRQKTRYIRHLSECILDRSLRVGRLPHLEDDAVRDHLIRVTGIGGWTADVYLLMSLQRPDVWPAADVALQAAAHELKGLSARPGVEELEVIGEQWRPWRSVAARILWHYYLSTPRLSKPGKK